MGMKKIFESLLLWSLILLSPAFSRSHMDRSNFTEAEDKHTPKLLQALRDFEFVAQGNGDPLSVPAHGVQRIALPERLEARHLYVFHHRPVENGELFKQLQTRLRSEGVEVLKANGDIERYLGGLAFAISFQDGGVSGVIYNTLDTELVRDAVLSAKWALDDYVLVINPI